MRGKGGLVILVLLIAAMVYTWILLKQMIGEPVTVSDYIPLELQRLFTFVFRKISDFFYTFTL